MPWLTERRRVGPDFVADALVDLPQPEPVEVVEIRGFAVE